MRSLRRYSTATARCPFEQHARRLRVGEDGEVLAAAHRSEERARCARPAAPPLRHLTRRHAVLRCAVEIGVRGNAGFSRGVEERAGERARAAQILDGERSRPTVKLALAARVALRTAKRGQYLVPRPAGVPALGPCVVVEGIPTDVHLCVDRRGPAQRASAGPVERPLRKLRLRCCRVVPVVVGLEQLRERRGDADLSLVVGWAGLEEQDRGGGIRCQSVGQHASGRSGTHDHVVVPVPREGAAELVDHTSSVAFDPFGNHFRSTEFARKNRCGMRTCPDRVEAGRLRGVCPRCRPPPRRSVPTSLPRPHGWALRAAVPARALLPAALRPRRPIPTAGRFQRSSSRAGPSS